MKWDFVVEYVTNQAPMFVVAVLGLFVAGLALAFGICVTYYTLRKKS